MSRCVISALLGYFAITLAAGDLEGLVHIEKRLTKRKVTAPSSTYQRGTAVPLNTKAEDPLVHERLRVVIYVDGKLPVEPVTAEMEQKNRAFTPETIVVPLGSTVSFPNLDPIFHNVFSLSKVKSFDLGNYPRNQTRTVVFEKPGIVFVHCHLHPNMSAAIVVSPNSWSTKPDRDGKYRISGIPPGNHKIVAWHKATGLIEKSIRVNPEGTSRLDFIIPLTEEAVAAGSLAQR